METKNIILNNYSIALNNITNNYINVVSTLNDNADENAATIKTLNVIIESLRSQTVLIQQEIDKYFN